MRTTAGIAATKEETSPVQEQKKGEGLKTNKPQRRNESVYKAVQEKAERKEEVGREQEKGRAT